MEYFITFHPIFGILYILVCVFVLSSHQHLFPSLSLFRSNSFFAWCFWFSASVMEAGIRIALRTDCTEEVQSKGKKTNATEVTNNEKKKWINNWKKKIEKERERGTERRTLAPHNNSMQCNAISNNVTGLLLHCVQQYIVRGQSASVWYWCNTLFYFIYTSINMLCTKEIWNPVRYDKRAARRNV